MAPQYRRRLATVGTTLLLSLSLFVGPAAASHDGLSCTVPSGLNPLLSFMHTLEQLAFLAGISIGTLGFLVASINLMMPGQNSTRRGKDIAKNVLLGAILLLSAHAIMAFLIAEFGTTICN